MAWGFLQRTPAASEKAQECSRTVVAPCFEKRQPFPDAGLGHDVPRLKVMQMGSVDLETISLTLNLVSLFVDAEGGGLFLRDGAAEVLSLREDSFRVLTCC